MKPSSWVNWQLIIECQEPPVTHYLTQILIGWEMCSSQHFGIWDGGLWNWEISILDARHEISFCSHFKFRYMCLPFLEFTAFTHRGDKEWGSVESLFGRRLSWIPITQELRLTVVDMMSQSHFSWIWFETSSDGTLVLNETLGTDIPVMYIMPNCSCISLLVCITLRFGFLAKGVPNYTQLYAKLLKPRLRILVAFCEIKVLQRA